MWRPSSYLLLHRQFLLYFINFFGIWSPDAGCDCRFYETPAGHAADDHHRHNGAGTGPLAAALAAE
jgi:hypothetical protein